MKVSVVNYAGGSFCWNYATDTYNNYADANICCNYAGFEILLQLCLLLSATYMLVDLFVVIMQVIVFVAIMLLEVSAVFMQVKVCATNMWVTIFIEIMHVRVSLAIIQVVFSTVHFAHDYFYCNYAGD